MTSGHVQGERCWWARGGCWARALVSGVREHFGGGCEWSCLDGRGEVRVGHRGLGSTGISERRDLSQGALAGG